MDIAALNLEARSDSVKQATVDLKAMVPAASAAERAAQRWGLTTAAATRSSEDFSKRVQRTIRDLEFERQQLGRSSAEKQRYAALQRAGVAAHSAEGRAITAAVQALQAQRAAYAGLDKSLYAVGASAKASGGGVAMLARSFGPLAGVLLAAAAAQKVFMAGMRAGDLGEQAEQIGVNTEQLQAYRFAGAQAGIETEQFDTALTKLAKSMGAAADGGKEQIELFDRLGVKLLDARGELRPVADVLPEVARGVLAIGSSSQRTATLMELFGRSGAKMTTVLEQLAEGNEKVIDSAKRQGALIGAETIKVWDDFGDKLKVAGVQLDVLFATLSRPVAAAGLQMINVEIAKMTAGLRLAQKAWDYISSGPSGETLDKRAKTIQATIDAMTSGAAGDLDDIGKARLAGLYRQLGDVQQQISDQQTAAYMPTITVTADAPGPGVRNPLPKASGSDPYAKAMESGRQYIASKNAETAALGLSAEAAARLKHEQDLLNRVTGEGRTVTDAQRLALQGLAQDMAAADSALATGKFMHDAKTRSEEFLAQQQVERDSIFLSTEAAAKLRYENEMLNLAKQQGITLTAEQASAISDYAGAMASAEAQTRHLREAFDFAKDVAKGFFTDLRQGLQQGQSIWDAFANAGVNALNKIADKLFEMAIDAMITQLLGSLLGGGLGGGMGGGGGLIGGLIGGLFADGAAFRNGAVLPFARGAAFINGAAYLGAEQRFASGGAIVNRPTVFPMAGGRRGLMGEAGPEAIVPLHRGRDGGLGIRMTGARGGGGVNGQQPVVVTVTGDTDLVRVTARDEFGRGIAVVGPQIEGRAVKRAGEQAPAVMARHEAQRGGEWR